MTVRCLMLIIPYYWSRFLGSWSGETGPAVGPSAARSHTDPLRSRTPLADTAAPQSTSETDSSYKQIFQTLGQLLLSETEQCITV